MVPRRETQALSFLEHYPESDGRGIKVAILDTGVDPSAEGLSETSDGRPKIVELRDCSGDGDVTLVKERVSTPVKREREASDTVAEIEGLHGEVLLIGKEAFGINGRNKWWIGQKDISSFFPSKVCSNINRERNEKTETFSRALVSNLEKKDKSEERDAEIRFLKQQQHRHDKIVATCVVFLDDRDVFHVMIDKQGTGDFTDAKILRSFHVAQEYDVWGGASVAVNVITSDALDEASSSLDLTQIRLSIVIDSGSHGTHVASIVAGNHSKDKADLNGVAPGAQIVGLKIGDGRLDAMETSKSIIRAVTFAVQSGCQLANMSFGEASLSCMSGAVMECIEEAASKHGLIFVTSAGNSGPCLGTVGAPGNSSCGQIITVAAMLSSEMRQSQYLLNGQVEKEAFGDQKEALYDWSSRGPTYSGGIGVTIAAPGGAIASVTSWSEKTKQLMNGTSMASPNACGCLALVLSGLKKTQTPYSPFSVRRVVMNTARLMENEPDFAFGQGHGVLQTLNCFEMLVRENAETLGQDSLSFFKLPFKTLVNGSKEGILLRNGIDWNSPAYFSVHLKPVWNMIENSSLVDAVTHFSKMQKKKFSLDLSVEVDAEHQPWIKTTERLLVYANEAIQVDIVPALLPPGHHFAWISVYEASYSSAMGEKLPFFRIPVTVIKPMNVLSSPIPKELLRAPALEEMRDIDVKLSPGTLKRFFLAVPAGKDTMTVRVTRKSFSDIDAKDLDQVFFCSTLQKLDGGSYRKDLVDNVTRIQKGTSFELDVVPYGIAEFTIAQYWKTIGNSEIRVSFDFTSIQSDTKLAIFDEDNDYAAEVHLTNFAAPQRITASVSFTEFTRVLLVKKSSMVEDWDFPLIAKKVEVENAPKKVHGRSTMNNFFSKLIKGEKGQPLTESTNAKTSLLVIEYELELTAPERISLSLSTAHKLLYESPFSCHMIQVYTPNDELVATFDSFPKHQPLSAGKYVVKLCLGHSDKKFLKSFERKRLKVSFACTAQASVSIFHGEVALVNTRGGFNYMPAALSAERYFLKLGRVTAPSSAVAGDLLKGFISFKHSNVSPGISPCRTIDAALCLNASDVVPQYPNKMGKTSSAPKSPLSSLDSAALKGSKAFQEAYDAVEKQFFTGQHAIHMRSILFAKKLKFGLGLDKMDESFLKTVDDFITDSESKDAAANFSMLKGLLALSKITLATKTEEKASILKEFEKSITYGGDLLATDPLVLMMKQEAASGISKAEILASLLARSAEDFAVNGLSKRKCYDAYIDLLEKMGLQHLRLQQMNNLKAEFPPTQNLF